MREPLEDLQLKVGAVQERLMRDFNNWQIYIGDLVIPTVNQTVGALCSSIKERHQVGMADIHGPVYCVHYTSVDTIVSILYSFAKGERDYLRSYDSWNMNDPSEGSYFMKQTGNLMLELSNPPPPNMVQHAYVTSFILDQNNDMSDALLFWRMYGRNGEGCSLRLPVTSNRFFRVLYGSCEAKKTGRELQQIYDNYKPQILEILYPIGIMIDEKIDTVQANSLVAKMTEMAFIEEL